MKKSILNVGKALSKADQTEIIGGVLIKKIKTCAEVCPTSTSSIKCGPPHCPGVCDGRGGWVLY
ncbi:hypothetical protein [uncultured Tenacibaculum sp.]|uniref:hypothetical protein n=1 Tax=uncultured Tenacibaculum sp. TaxID=174713 RepID=UPI002638D559|nr:hypothetical protein [uncultured Tenacibaculum sp.]